MRGITVVNRSQYINAFESTVTLCFLFVVGIFCMIFGLVNIFNGDERLSMIVQQEYRFLVPNRYNEFAILWNETLRFDFEKAALVPQINGNTTNLTKNTTASGLYYPYRDSCSRKNDPICVQVPAFYWSTVFPLRILSNVTINITDFSETIPVKRVWELEKSAIHCEGGSQYSYFGFCYIEQPAIIYAGKQGGDGI